ncbi:MAG: peptidyl-prolyl cis-trans isomerase, partial [Bacteroidetes bacterium]
SKEEEVYLVKFFDYKIKDDISPLELEYDDIRNIIINKRKMELIKKMRNDIYQNALTNKEFEIYYNE